MAITFLPPVSLDGDNQTTAERRFTGTAFDLGDGRVVYAWQVEFRDAAALLYTETAFFSVVDLSGNVLVPPTQVDATNLPDPTGTFGFTQAVYGAAPTPEGGFVLHYSLEPDRGAVFAAEGYVRSFSADGTPQGPGTPIPGGDLFLFPEQVTAQVLSTGALAVAHEGGLTVMDGQTGVYIGGETVDGPVSRTRDGGFSIIETGGGIVTFTMDRFGVITAQRLDMTGTPQGAPVTIDSAGALGAGAEPNGSEVNSIIRRWFWTTAASRWPGPWPASTATIPRVRSSTRTRPSP